LFAEISLLWITEQCFFLLVVVLEIGPVVSTQVGAGVVAGARRKNRKIVSSIFMLYCCGGRLERVRLNSEGKITVFFVPRVQYILSVTSRRQKSAVAMIITYMFVTTSTVVILIYLSDGQIIALKQMRTTSCMRELFFPHFGM
jgi:hypothetical protein